jgi:hypothetical protein
MFGVFRITNRIFMNGVSELEIEMSKYLLLLVYGIVYRYVIYILIKNVSHFDGRYILQISNVTLSA